SMGRPWGAGGWISPRSRLGQWMNRRWWHFYVGLGVINTLLWFLASYIGVLGGRSEHKLGLSLISAIFSAFLRLGAQPRVAARYAAEMSRSKGTLRARDDSCRLSREALEIMARQPVRASSAPRTRSSRSQDSLDRPAPSARDRGRDHDEDGCDDDADDPPDPVDAARRLNPECCGAE